MILSLEDKLLLSCARTTIDKKLLHILEDLIASDLDWDYVIEKAFRNHIASLFYHHFGRITKNGTIPQSAIDKTKRAYHATACRNMYIFNELNKALKAIRGAKIEVIALKGAALAEKVYQNIALRPIYDIDLLVKEKDLPMVKEILCQMGYEYTVGTYPTKWHAQQAHRIQINRINAHHLPPFIARSRAFSVEIHWDIQSSNNPFRIDINDFWKNAQPVRIADVEALALAPENLLQHLCLHLYKHSATSGARLIWYCDIAEVARYYQEKIDWGYFLQSCKKYRIKEPVYQNLYLVWKYHRAPIPLNVLNELKFGNDIDIENNLIEMLKGEIKNKKRGSEIDYLKILLKVNGIQNKLRYLLGSIFPCREFLIYRYSIKKKNIVYIYYPIRLWAAFFKGMCVLWQLICHPISFMDILNNV